MMNPLKSLTDYSRFVAELLHSAAVERSTVAVWSDSPYHKHVPPDIKHNRVPAPGMSFTRANLPRLIREIEELTRI